MKRIENECVCCDNCVNCGRRQTEVYYCDRCDCEIGNVGFVYNGEELCNDCAKNILIDKFFFNSQRILNWVKSKTTVDFPKSPITYEELYNDYLQDESFEDLAADLGESYVRI